MYGNCRTALAIFIILVTVFASCRKNSGPSQSPWVPGDTIPGTDTTGNDTIPDPGAAQYNQVAVPVRINSNVGGYYEALPPAYSENSNKKFPLLLFLHGGGEFGNGSTDLPLILKNSLTKRLHEKTIPPTFTVNGEEFSLIIISPQFAQWPSTEDIHDVFEHVLDKYRVDTARIYLSGLSMGGGETWEYAGSKYGKSLAAIVPICGASWADSATAKRIATNEVPGWAFHNIDDDAVTVNSTKRYVGIINSQKPKHPIKMTLWDAGGHDAWTLASDPEYREDGKNMYEWMLQYAR